MIHCLRMFMLIIISVLVVVIIRTAEKIIDGAGLVLLPRSGAMLVSIIMFFTLRSLRIG